MSASKARSALFCIRLQFFLDFVKVDVRETNSETGLREDTLLKPYGSTINNWGKCASYDLEKYSKELSKVVIYSPVTVYVLFHSKDQFSIPKELSTKVTFEGLQSIECWLWKFNK